MELCHRYILENLKGAQQCGYLNEQSFGLWLSLSVLLWNSTRNLDGVSPSQLQFSGVSCRTHQFITLSNLHHQQSRSFLTQQIQEASNFLSMVCLRRKQLNLQKQGQLENYDSNIHVGDLVLRQRMETKQARWKLKTKYFPTPYRVVITRPHYCIIMPLQASLEYYSSPFLKGSKLKKKGIRVARMYLKKIKNPYAYLNLQKGVKHLETAAGLLGTSAPVRQIILGPPLPPSRTNHPFYKQFAQPPGYADPESTCTKYTDSTIAGTQKDICFTEVPPFVSEIHSNRSRIDQFVGAVKSNLNKKQLLNMSLGVLKGDSHYIYILSKNYSWPRSLGPEITCSYKYQTLYDQMRKKYLQNRMDYLRQISSSVGGSRVSERRQPGRTIKSAGRQLPHKQFPPLPSHKSRGQAPYYSDDPLENFDTNLLNNYLDVCSYYSMSHIYPIVLSQLQNLNNDCADKSSSDSSSGPKIKVTGRNSNSAVSSQSATTGSQHSYQSIQSNRGMNSPVNDQNNDHISLEQNSTSIRGSDVLSSQSVHRNSNVNSCDSDQGSFASLQSLEQDRRSDFSDSEIDQTIMAKPWLSSKSKKAIEAGEEAPAGHDPPDVLDGLGRQRQDGPSHQIHLQHPTEVPPMLDFSQRSTKKSTLKSTQKSFTGSTQKTNPIPIPDSGSSAEFSREDLQLQRPLLSADEAEFAASASTPKSANPSSKGKTRTSVRLKMRK